MFLFYFFPFFVVLLKKKITTCFFFYRRIIAMAYPGTGMEGMYRNNISDVSKFLNMKHAEDYMVCLKTT